MRVIQLPKLMEPCIKGPVFRACVLLSVLFLFCLAPFTSTQTAGTDSCVACHTDDQRMKSLVKTPEVGSEGEG